jgi:dTDP-4-amino-4,6-dideoxygalactose transaminase
MVVPYASEEERLMPGPGLDSFGDEERGELLDVIESRRLSRYRFDDDSSGPSKTYLFERGLERHLDVRHALGTNSCTSALLLGMWSCNIGPGDEVIVPGYTFIAPIAAIAYAGATPVLAEIDESLTLDPNDVVRKITPRTKAIMAVHMLGLPCDMEALTAVAQRHGLLLVEDCAQAGGGHYRGRALGTFGAWGAFSLNVFKTITAGDGGVLVTNDTALYERAFAMHDHGSKPHRAGVADADSVLGLNFRMHEMTGAVARAQLRKLPGILAHLRANKAALRAAIGTLPGCAEAAGRDPSGECATVLPFTFATPQAAAGVASELGTIVLACSGKHNYANMPQLARGPGPRALSGSFAPGVLARTDSLLGRSVALSVGVVDSYLGTGFGISLGSGHARIDEIAAAFRSAVRAQSVGATA